MLSRGNSKFGAECKRSWTRARQQAMSALRLQGHEPDAAKRLEQDKRADTAAAPEHRTGIYGGLLRTRVPPCSRV